MLILTRKLGESINIGNDIKISVLNISGLQVRIGVEAPPDIIVHREEIFNKIHGKNKKESPEKPFENDESQDNNQNKEE